MRKLMGGRLLIMEFNDPPIINIDEIDLILCEFECDLEGKTLYMIEHDNGEYIDRLLDLHSGEPTNVAVPDLFIQAGPTPNIIELNEHGLMMLMMVM